MPVIPSFQVGGQPNMAQAYLGGVQSAQTAQRISQEAAIANAKLALDAQQHAQTLQFQREKLAQDAAQAQMEFQSKMKVTEQEQLRREHQLEIDRAYKEATLGLRDRQLQQQEQVAQARAQQAQMKMMLDQAYRQNQLGMQERGLDIREDTYQIKADEAAEKYAAQQNYQKKYQEKIAAGMKPDEASREAILESNPAMFGGAGSAAVRRPVEPMGRVTAAPLLDESGKPTGALQAPTGRGSVKIWNPPIPEGTGLTKVPGTSEYGRIGNRFVRLRDPAAPKRTELKALRTAQEKDLTGRIASNTKKEGKKLTATDKLALQTYEDREKRIQKLEEEIEKLEKESASQPTSTGTNQPVTLPPGMDTRQYTTNQVGRFKVVTPK